MQKFQCETQMRAKGIVAWALLVGPAMAQVPGTPELEPREVLTIRWVLPTGEIYPRQPFDLSLDVWVEGSVGSSGLLQLIPQDLDLPVQIRAFVALRDQVMTLPEGPPAGDGATVVVDGNVQRAFGPFPGQGAASGGQRYRITRRARVLRPGMVALPPPSLHFARATSFRNDLVRGRVPVDRTEGSARGLGALLDVIPLPSAGRPLTFEGAVGHFTLSSTVEPRAAQVGETVTLQVLVEGATRLHEVLPPHLDADDLVDVLGLFLEVVEGGTLFTYELAFLSTACVETPPLTLAVFDPQAEPPAYVVLQVAPLPVAIRPASSPPAEETPAEEETPGSASKLIWTPLTLGVILLLAIASVVRRRFTGAPPDP